jgi:LacI family transcriptional regulator
MVSSSETNTPGTGQATMKDVAATAGVGLGTVSRVLGGTGPVSAATREKVQEAARRLNYRPSAMGRGLRSMRSRILGLSLADLGNTFYGEFGQTVISSAEELDLRVMIGTTGDDVRRERDWVELMLEQRAEGIIAFPTGGNTDLWRTAIDLGVRVVFADRPVEGVDAPTVLVNNALGAYALTEYLIGLGHERIAYLGGPADVFTAMEREAGFRRACADAGVAVREELLGRAEFTRGAALAFVQRWLGSETRPTALFAANNVLAERALAVIGAMGVRVPDDLSFVMFDDTPWSQLVRPPVTVVSQPTSELGKKAVELLTGEVRTGHVVMPSELVIRSSACPPMSGPRGAAGGFFRVGL